MDVICWACGTNVTTVVGKFKGVITEILIRYNQIQYQITRMSNGDVYTSWLVEEEFKVERKAKTVKIGFYSEDNE